MFLLFPLEPLPSKVKRTSSLDLRVPPLVEEVGPEQPQPSVSPMNLPVPLTIDALGNVRLILLSIKKLEERFAQKFSSIERE